MDLRFFWRCAQAASTLGALAAHSRPIQVTWWVTLSSVWCEQLIEEYPQCCENSTIKEDRCVLIKCMKKCNYQVIRWWCEDFLRPKRLSVIKCHFPGFTCFTFQVPTKNPSKEFPKATTCSPWTSLNGLAQLSRGTVDTGSPPGSHCPCGCCIAFGGTTAWRYDEGLLRCRGWEWVMSRQTGVCFWRRDWREENKLERKVEDQSKHLKITW